MLANEEITFMIVKACSTYILLSRSSIACVKYDLTEDSKNLAAISEKSSFKWSFVRFVSRSLSSALIAIEK